MKKKTKTFTIKMNKIFYVKKTHIRTQYIIKQLIARTRWGNWVRVDMYVGLRLSCIEWRVSWRVTEQGSVRSLVIAFTFSKANKKYVSFNLYKRLIQNTHTQKKLQPEVKRRSKKKYERANMNNSHKWHWRVDIIVVCLSKTFFITHKGIFHQACTQHSQK